MFFRNLVFRFVLWALGLRLGWLARNNDSFRDKIKDQDFVLQFGTADGAVTRYFTFAKGTVTSHGGAHEQPASSITFADAKIAMDTLMAAGKDQSVFMKAMGEGKVKAGGSDMSKLMVFMQIARYIGPQKKKAKPAA